MLPIDFKDSLAPNLGKTVKMMEERIDHMLQAHGFDLTKMQFVLLHKLHDHEGVSQNDLALARIPSKEDKRVNNLFVTATGLEVLEKTTPIFKEVSDIIQKDISPDEIASTINVLKKIQANVKEDFAYQTTINSSSNKNQ